MKKVYFLLSMSLLLLTVFLSLEVTATKSNCVTASFSDVLSPDFPNPSFSGMMPCFSERGKGDPGWVITPGMETNMSVYITSATLDGVPVLTGKVAAFDLLTNQCRAVEEFFDDGSGVGQAILTVGFNSDEQGHTFYYKVWDSGADIVYDVNETGTMVPDDFQIVDLTLVMPPPSISGTVTDELSSLPLANVQISATPVGKSFHDGEPVWIITPGMETNMSVYVTSATLDGVPVQTGKVAAFDALTNQCRAVEDFFDGGTGAGQAILTVGFNSEENGNAYYYKVWDSSNDVIYSVNETGTYVPDGFVMIDLTLIPSAEPLITYTSEYGTYCFSDIPDGTYIVCTGLSDPTTGYIDECAPGSYTTPPGETVNFSLMPLCQNPPTANAGSDGTICETSTLQLSGNAQYQSSVQWTTTGNGTFNNTNILDPVYTPGTNDIISGAVTLTLLANPVSPCVNPSMDDMTLIIRKEPLVNAGSDASVCEGSNHLVTGSVQYQTSILWSTSGTGTFGNPSALSTNYTPSTADITAGSVVLTLTASATSPCTLSKSDSKILVIVKNPVANAGPDGTVCEGMTAQLAGTAQNQSSILWVTSGSGTYNNPTLLNPVYTPSAADIAAGQVVLTITAIAITPCWMTFTDSKLLYIRKSPVVNAGSDATTCQNSSLQLAGTAQNQSSVLWTTSGTGTFSNPTSLNPFYVPSTGDIISGTVNLTLSAFAISPCVTTATDFIVMTIQQSPFVNAGNDATICQGGTLQLSGTVFFQSSFAWTTSGTGTFNNPLILNPVYTPSSEDINAGSVTLTLTAMAISPCFAFTTDAIILTIQKLPTANAGSDATICQGNTHQLSGVAQYQSSVLWTTSGSGTFNNPTALTPIYAPSIEDINAGSVTLSLTAFATSPCVIAATDAKILSFQKLPIANAGSDATVCQGNTYQLAGTAQNQNSVLWTTSGTGTFNSPASLNPVYTPSTGDINAGTVTLTLTASAISPCTVAASDAMVLTIQKLPTANAGADATICQNNTAQLSGTSQNYLSVLWTTSGTGTFNNPVTLNPVYTPSTGDINAGSVTLTLAALAISPCTVSATDNMLLTIQKLPVVNAGNDAEICADGNLQLNGTASYYTSVLWSTSGDGTFGNPSGLSTTYNPGNNDITSGMVDLTLTGFAILPCISSANSTLTLTIHPLPDVTFGSIDNLCVNWGPYQLIEGSPAGGVYSGPFVTNGWFYPAQSGVGSFVLTYTYTDGFGCSNSANSTVIVDPCTSITEQSATSVMIVPNPGNGYFTLQLTGNAGKEYDMKIFSGSGKVVMESEVRLNDENKVTIDLTSQPQGLYFLILTDNDNQIISRKLVISR